MNRKLSQTLAFAILFTASLSTKLTAYCGDYKTEADCARNGCHWHGGFECAPAGINPSQEISNTCAAIHDPAQCRQNPNCITSYADPAQCVPGL